MSKKSPIAIVGVSALFPSSNDATQFWQHIVNGKDLTSKVPTDYWLTEDYYDSNPSAEDKTYSKRGAFLDGIDFNCSEFGILPNSAEATDTSQLLALIAAKHVLADITKQHFQEIDLAKASIILGATGAQELMLTAAARLDRPLWLQGLREHGIAENKAQKICDAIAKRYTPWQESTFPGLLGNVIAGRIANRFDLGGSNCVVDAACASSLAACKMGISELQLGDSDLVITGGVDTMQNISMYMCFSKTPALSKTDDCRPFSDKADGTLLGEGLCFIAMKRLADAKRDNNYIYAVIHGIGASSDGKGKSVYAPASEGQAHALANAYENANYSPTTVELVEAHGTGTIAGDAAEFEGLRSVFCAAKHDDKLSNWCALGSIKSQIGHTKSTAGAAGLFKAVMALNHKILPPTIKVDKPNPALNIEQSPFYLNAKARPWIRDNKHPRRASVSAFGFGGSNFHVTLEEYQNKTPQKLRYRTLPSELFIFHASSAADIAQSCQELLNRLEKNDYNFARLANETQINNNPENRFRLAITANNNTDLKQKLQQALNKLNQNPTTFSLPSIEYASEQSPGKIACLFPGQGSQYLNMTADLAMAHEDVINHWDHLANLEQEQTIKLHQVVFPIPTFTAEDQAQQLATLQQTKWAQPAITQASMGLFNVLTGLNIQPDCLAGHSAGELTALCAAQCFSVDILLYTAKQRAQLMQRAAKNHTGAMLAVLHPATELTQLLDKWQLDISVANYNSPQQTVLSGAISAIEKLQEKLTQEKIAFKRLAVDSAYHCPIVSEAAKPFENWLNQQKIKPARISVYSNVTAKPYSQDSKKIAAGLGKQISQSVQFVKIIEAMYAQGVRTFIDVGPNNTLSGLIKQTLAEKPHCTISLDHPKKHGITNLLNALAKLYTHGINLNFGYLWKNYRIDAHPPEKKPNEFSIKIRGCNYNKPYPPKKIGDIIPPQEPDSGLQQINRKEDAMSNQSADHKPKTNQANSLASLVLNFQNQIAQAHSLYQKTMADTHTEFLRVAERNLAALSGAPIDSIVHQTNTPPLSTTTVQSMPIYSAPIAQQPVVETQAVVSATMQAAPTMQAAVNNPQTVASSIMPQPQAAPEMQQPVFSPQPIAEPQATAEVAPTLEPVSNSITETAAADLHTVMLDVVAEKTGYPSHMINMDMDMESDLGIDSIKRVEILSGVQSKVPNLPKLDPNRMTALKTLNEIVEYFNEALDAEDNHSKKNP